MGKSILVLDTPECCDYCPAGRIFGTAGQVECRAGRGISVNPDGKTVPGWCPLQPSSETEVGWRLIDANRFKNLVTAVCIMDGRSPEFLNEFCRLIDRQPTAYDVDKVMERLECEYMMCRCPNNEVCTYPQTIGCCYDNGIKKAVEIVKSGGIE